VVLLVQEVRMQQEDLLVVQETDLFLEDHLDLQLQQTNQTHMDFMLEEEMVVLWE
jgi:hypothetical protein